MRRKNMKIKGLEQIKLSTCNSQLLVFAPAPFSSIIMGSYISRQPNGLLCRFSSVVDCVTDYNMTDEEYIEMCAERGKEEAREVLEKHLQPYERVIQDTKFYNMSKKKFAKIREAMEITKELKK